MNNKMSNNLNIDISNKKNNTNKNTNNNTTNSLGNNMSNNINNFKLQGSINKLSPIYNKRIDFVSDKNLFDSKEKIETN